MNNTNLEILTQGALAIGVMVLILSPEFFALAKGIQGKVVVCVLGIISKVTAVYFFTSIISGTFLG